MFFLPALLGAAGAVAGGVGAAGAAGLGALGSLAGGLGAVGSAGLGALGSGLGAAGSAGLGALGAGGKFLLGTGGKLGAGLAGPPAQQGFLAKTLGSAGAKKLGQNMVDAYTTSVIATALKPKPKAPPYRSPRRTYSPGFNVPMTQSRSAQPSQIKRGQYSQPRSSQNYDRLNQAMKKKYGRTFFV